MQNNTFSRLYLRQNLIVLNEVSSTNDYLRQHLSNIKPLPEATAIMAIQQTQGKGQRGNTWHSSPEESLTISFLLYPQNLSVQQAFNLNMMISIGIQEWLTKWLPHTQIKWPNDLYVNHKKLGGILIENQLSGTQIRSSIIGIGINIHQKFFPADIAQRATSLDLEGNTHPQHFTLKDYALSLLGDLLTSYSETDLNDTEGLLNKYQKNLYQKDTIASYQIEKQIHSGILQGVEPDGRLRVNINGKNQLFDFKEIRFLK